MSAVDFLFEGSAPTPGSTSQTSSVQLPEWYTQYATDMLGKAQAVSNLPYATYTGPRIAGFTPTELQGFEATKQAAGAYKPLFGQAGAALGKAGEISGLGAAAADLTKAAGMSGAGAAQPMFGKAAGMSGVAAAQPYMDIAGRTFPQAAAEYMNPYTKAVVEQLGDVGVRQLTEKYLPEIGEEFIRAGQFGPGPGSTRMGEFASRALRDVQQSVLAEQSKALQAGYGQAADIFASDVNRIAEIGGRMGQLTGDDATRMAEIGKATGQLTAQDAETLSRIGSTRGELSLKDAESLRDLASKYSVLGEAEQTAGLRGAAAITGVGEKERGMQQANLELAYKDFLEQQGYPAEQVKFLAGILSGIQLPKTEVTTSTTTPAQQGGPSVFEQIVKGGAGVQTIIDFLKNYKPSSSETTTPTG